MKFLPHLLVGLCLLITSAATLAQSVTADNLANEGITAPQSSTLSSEDMQYIQLECEGFAKEDNINAENHPAYIKTCIDELSTAVKHAMYQLQATSEHSD